ncbi:aspartate aminotransferase family protein [bacterium]|nr:aspartate aminotransferase family protein [bacterium]MCI0603521.1 aspartate aminotransferase family protein [bacterium]
MDKISETTAQLTYGTWRLQKNWKPLHIVDAEGCYFTDSEGKKYLDFCAQLMCSLLGHKNQAVIQAIVDQAKKLPYIAPAFATTERAQLSELLLKVLPSGLNRFFYTTSGTEANEAAFKIARMVTGKSRIISRYRSYHGSTMGSIAATGDFRRWFMEPASKIPNVSFAPEVDCYRCPLHHKYPECNVACADYIDHILQNENDVAAVIVEPVVGTNGILVPPKEYMPRLREICNQHKVLLIADEVMSGWGRTGKWFAVDHWDVKPDILTTAKGITSAYVPLGLCATTSEVAGYFDDHYFAHGHTYEAHPLTIAAAIAAIGEYERLNLIERAAEMERYMEQKLRVLQEKHACIGDVRGIGLFWTVDLAKDRATKAPFNTFKDKTANVPLVVDRIAAEMLKNGVYIQAWVNHFIIAPPLIITREEIDQGVAALDAALKNL